MAQIKNKTDIRDSIADEMLILSRRLPEFFNKNDEMNPFLGVTLSVLIHGFVMLLMFICMKLGIVLPFLKTPELPSRDIEFKLVQQESKPPINKKTKIRADRDSQAGGKHDPKKPISAPSPKPVKPSAPAQPKQQAQQKQPPKPAVQQQKQVSKPVQQPKQVSKPVPAKPSAVKAPTANLKPSVQPATQGVPKPSAPKVATAPKSPFTIPTPSASPAGKTYKPQGTPSSGGSSNGTSSGSAPAPKFSSTSGGSSGSRPSSGGSSYASRGTSGGYGGGGNPSPGNPNGAPGIDAIKQPNWGPYMRDLEQRIKKNWMPPKGDTSKRVVIAFTISRDGRLLSKRVIKSSGVPLADTAAMSAIEQTAPFRPLPPEYKGQSVPIEFTFDYNVVNSVMR